MLEVTLLGQFDVRHHGRRIRIPTRNSQALLAYLLLNAGKDQRRERLAGLLWPDSSEDNARSNLRHELWRLRKALKEAGDSYFVIDDVSLAFDPHSQYSLDVHTFESAAAAASSADDLIAALSVYHGELLPGFYEEWVFVERQRLHALFETHMARLLEMLQVEGRWAEMQEWGMRWIGAGGWPEPAYRALMTAYANSGNVSRAVVTYERLAQGLQEELGTQPSEHTRALYKRLKFGWKTSAQTQVPAPTLPVAPLPRLRRSNLPRPLTSFIGREKEIHQVERLISGARLVTVTGAGGVGKTRLAIQLAGVLAPQFREGVCWVELAPLFEIAPSTSQPGSGHDSRSANGDAAVLSPQANPVAGAELVARAVARALRVPEAPGVNVLEGLLEHLHERQLLLILDNCEHLIAACATLAERALQDCPDVTVLATSREPLGVPGEKAWYLPSLSLPEAGPASPFSRILRSEAVSLFIERSADILPGYQPGEEEAQIIAQICLRLDGIPLAIELAAARMNLLSVGEIASRLDDRFSLLTAGRRTALPRHQTLRAAIEWSYDLLSASEQILFRRLSIFASSFTLEAAEAAGTGDGIQTDDVLTLLARLVDKSLLHVDPSLQDPDMATRYRLLDSICSFGGLKLQEAGETTRMRDRHAAYFVGLVESAEPELLLSNQGFWYKLLQAETDNIRAVIEWGTESDQGESALRMVGALLWFWWSHGSIREGLELALKALALPSAARFPEYRARALNTAGYLQWTLGDVPSARRSLDEALAILKSSGDESSLVWLMQFLGLVLASEGQYDLAEDALQDGIAIAHKLGNLNKGSFSLAFHGDIPLKQGDRIKAKKVYEESANLLRALGNKLFVAYPQRRLGYFALEEDDLKQASYCFRESLTLNREGGDRRAVAACITSFAALAIRLDRPVEAARLLGAAESRLESLSINLLHLDQIELGRASGRLQESLDEATFSAAFEEGWQMNEEQVMDLVKEIIDSLD
ncbi:MAG TPA: BTAD domain-containing putative transcriptional regulator [Anaerolineales bacterium]